MKKRVIALMMAGIMAASFSGCGKPSNTAPNSPTTDPAGETASEDNSVSGETVTITVASRYAANTPDEEYYRKMVEEFNNQNNGVKVEMDNISAEADYLNKLRASFANGDTPNVFIEFGGSRTIDYLESDALVNMKTYFDEDPDWYNSFYVSMFRDLSYEGYDGIWGVPFKSYAVSLYYNKEIFEQQNLTPPASWDDLIAICEKLKAAGIKPFQAGEKDIWRLRPFT